MLLHDSDGNNPLIEDQAFYQESLIWWNLSHPHILPLIGITDKAFTTTKVPCMVTPWMDRGNIRQCVEDLDTVHTWVCFITHICYQYYYD